MRRLLAILLAVAVSTPLFGADDWPQWRGAHRDGQSTSKGLRKEVPKEGLPVAWSVENVGVGYSSVAVKDGRLFTLGDLGGIEQIICLNAENGSRLWAKQPDPVAKELVARVSKEFREIDRDGNGRISEREALRRFGWDWNKFNLEGEAEDKNANRLRQHQRAEALFAKLDQDADGSLSFSEAGEILRDAFDRVDVPDKAADAQDLAERRTLKYLKLDQNGDGKVSKEEAKSSDLARRFELLDAKDAVTQKGDEILTRDEIVTGLAKHEAGRDGVITKQELVTFFENTSRGDDELSREELKGILGGYRDGAGDGPPGTPAVDGDRVYALGAMGDLSCLDAATGDTIWHVHLVRDFSGRRPGSGYCESPLSSKTWLSFHRVARKGLS